MRVEPVDATDELEVARRPRRVRAHALHVLLDRASASPDRPTTAAGARRASARLRSRLTDGQLVLGVPEQIQEAAAAASACGRSGSAASECRGSDPRCRGCRSGFEPAPSGRGRETARARSSTSGPYSTSRYSIARGAIDDPGRVGLSPRDAGSRRKDRARRPRPRSAFGKRTRRATAARRARAGAARAPAPAPTRSARSARARRGLSWPIFQSSAATTVAGQTKPPRLGPSGPRMIGMSPVKSTVPTAYGVVVDVGRVKPCFTAVGTRPLGLRARSAACRCGAEL